MMAVPTELAVFSNPWILENIFSNLGLKDLLNFRTVSKTFDDECVRMFRKRNYGCRLDRKKYLMSKDLRYNSNCFLGESRHPTFILGKVKIECWDEQDHELHQIIFSNLKHVKSLSFEKLNAFWNFDNFLKSFGVYDFSTLVELRIPLDMDAVNELKEPEVFSQMSFNFNNLTSLELDISGDGSESMKEHIALLIKKIIKGSNKLKMLSIKTWYLSRFLNSILEDVRLSKKLEFLKTLHLNDGDVVRPGPWVYELIEDNPMEKESNKEFILKLLSLVKNSIENLHISAKILEGLSTNWPEMPNLITLTFCQSLKVPKSDHLPDKTKAPKLKLLLLGHHDSWKCMWRLGAMSWDKEFELENKEMKCFTNGEKPIEKEYEQDLRVVLRAESIEPYWSYDITEFLKGLKVKLLFLRLTSKDGRRDSGSFLLHCIHEIPTLKRLIVWNYYENGVKIMDIPVYNPSVIIHPLELGV